MVAILRTHNLINQSMTFCFISSKQTKIINKIEIDCLAVSIEFAH